MRTFEVPSGKLIITDPCYKFDEKRVIPAKNGTWTASVNTNNQGVITRTLNLLSTRATLSPPSVPNLNPLPEWNSRGW